MIKVRASSPGTITNQAGVASAVNDPVSSNNSASTDTTVTAAADLSLTKSDSPDPVLEGELLTYSLTAHNSGPQDATGTSLTDTLPAGVTYESATPSQGTCSEAAGIVDCALGTIASGADATVEIEVRPSGPGTLDEPGSRDIRPCRPGLGRRERERRDDRATRSRTWRSPSQTHPTRSWPASCSPTRSA